MWRSKYDMKPDEFTKELDRLWDQVRPLYVKLHAYARLKQDPRHPSLHFKKVGRFCSARIGAHYRTLAVEVPDGLVWFWIGSHADYDRLCNREDR